MALVADIARAYLSPGAVVRERLGRAPSEPGALGLLLAGCGLMFVAQWPRLAREAALGQGPGLDAALTGALFAWLFLAPLAAYLAAGCAGLVLRLLGRAASGYAIRVATFWAFLAASPLWLAQGLVLGAIGPGWLADAVGLGAIAAFALFWAAGIGVAREGGGGAPA